MISEWVTFLIHDFRQALANIQLESMINPAYIILWIVILLYPLSGIDRQDTNSGLVYILYCLFSGAALFFALPKQEMKFSNFPSQVGILIFIGICAAYRWFHRKSETLTLKEREEILSKKETQKNGR